MCVFVSSSFVYVCVSVCRSCACVWVIKGAGSVGCWKRRLLLLWKGRVPISGSERWAGTEHDVEHGKYEQLPLLGLRAGAAAEAAASCTGRVAANAVEVGGLVVVSCVLSFTQLSSSANLQVLHHLLRAPAIASSSFPLVLHLSSLPPFVNAATSNEVQQWQETEIDQLDNMFELQSSSSKAANGRWLSFVL